ncbi:unnamed protein product, partial [marine sediment metagenome]
MGKSLNLETNPQNIDFNGYHDYRKGWVGNCQ